jgi:hypothetical protein
MSRDRNMNVIKASSLNYLNANNASPSLLANSNLQMISDKQKCANRRNNNKSMKNDDDGDTCQANKNERGGEVKIIK